MRKIAFASMLGWAFASSFMLDAKTVELKTGHWPIDRTRSVEIDNFDYIYEIKDLPINGRFIELKDGSLWQIEKLGAESISFYQYYKDVMEISFVEEVVDLWQPGERLIFHKIIDKEIDQRDIFLAYNIDRNQLIDLSPLSPPIYHCLRVSEVDTTNNLILLSDTSFWPLKPTDKALFWSAGDPILVAKDTPWRSGNTHVLINLKYSDNYTTLGHIERNRVSVVKIP